MKTRGLRILSALLAVALHVAVLAPAWLGSDTLAGGVGGPPEAGASMVISLAQQAPPEPEPVTEPTTKPQPEAIKTERTPEPEEKPEKKEEKKEKPQEEKPDAEAAEGESQDNRQRQRKAGDGRPAGAGAHHEGRDDDAWNRYLGELRRVIERHKAYPRQARLRRQEGEVRVRFTLDADGRVTEMALVGSSGSAILDRHVEQLMNRVEFPVPPEDVDIAGQAITLPVRFSLN